MPNGSKASYGEFLQEMKLFGVSFIYRAHFVQSNRPVGHVMESIRIVRSSSIETAKQRARVLGKENEHSYVNMDNDEIRWSFAGFKVFEILETDEILEVEVFSKLLDDKTGLSLLATGYEI